MVDFAGSPEVKTGAMPVPPAPYVESPPTSAEPQIPTTITQNGQLSSSDIRKFAQIATAPVVEEEEAKTEFIAEVAEKAEEIAEERTEIVNNLHECPKCGWNLENTIYDEPTETDKDEFIRSTLGSRRFKKEFEYMGGKVAMVFRSTLRAEELAVVDTLNSEINEKRIRTPEEWTLRNRELRMAAQLESVTIGTNKQEFQAVYNSEDENANLSDKIYKLVDRRAAWPGSIQSMAIFSQEQFEALHTTLVSRTYDSDFWIGLGDSNV